MAESFKLYKLIVLYMLDKVDFPLTNSQVSNLSWMKATPLISNCSRPSQSLPSPALSGKNPLTAAPSFILRKKARRPSIILRATFPPPSRRTSMIS